MVIHVECTYLGSYLVPQRYILTGVRSEFFSHLHRFLAHLTDAEHKASGHTMLYVPDEGPVMCDSEAHKNKEFVQRMEGMFFYNYIE